MILIKASIGKPSACRSQTQVQFVQEVVDNFFQVLFLDLGGKEKLQDFPACEADAFYPVNCEEVGVPVAKPCLRFLRTMGGGLLISFTGYEYRGGESWFPAYIADTCWECSGIPLQALSDRDGGNDHASGQAAGQRLADTDRKSGHKKWGTRMGSRSPYLYQFSS
jgi:hypothetical protein